MKQYTNSEQTAKLIELGFEGSKSIRYPKNEEEAERVDSIDFLISDYSIGELIEMLPEVLTTIGKCHYLYLQTPLCGLLSTMEAISSHTKQHR